MKARGQNPMQIAVARLAAMFLLALPLGASAIAAEPEAVKETPHYPLLHPKHASWSFSGPFGKYDPQQLQRGFQVYKDVCSTCHSLGMVAFRDLGSHTGPLFGEEEVKALAAEATVSDASVEGGQ